MSTNKTIKNIDPEHITIVKEIYLKSIRRDIVRDEFDLESKELKKIERQTIKAILVDYFKE